MRQILLILALLAAVTATAQHGYKITRAKVTGWGVLAFAGAVDGIVEGYEFDGRRSFERKYGVAPGSYFGSESWRRVYVGGNPDNGFKSGIHKRMGAADFYHHADDLRKIGYITGGVTIGIGGAKMNTKIWHYGVDFLAGFAVSAVTKSIGMQWVRQ